MSQQPARRTRADTPTLVLGGVTLLCASAIIAAQLHARRARQQLRVTTASPPVQDASVAAVTSTPLPAAAPISARLVHALENDDTPLQNLNHFIRMADPTRYPEYHRWSAPDGYISAAIAENKTTTHLLPYLTHRPGLGVREQSYQNFNGMPHVRGVLSKFLEHYVFGRAVSPDSLFMTAGANMSLDSLFFSLANPGEYVLLAKPYYAAFKWDLGLKSGVLIHEVEADPRTGFAFSLDAYKAALRDARSMGRVVRAILLCNPHNPCGTTLTRLELQSLVEWVRSEPGLHLVSDEVYALSVYANRMEEEEDAEQQQQPQGLVARVSSAARGVLGAVRRAAGFDGALRAPSPFVSLANVLSTPAAMGDRFHVIYAFSKDFGLSGFRCGMVYSENQQIRRGYDQLSQFNGLSVDVQHYFYLLLKDSAALSLYVDGMQRGLARVVRMLQHELRAANIPFVQGQGGIFIWLNLTAFLDAPTVDAETRLYEEILEQCNVNLTPGTSFHSPVPGYYRMCFMAAPMKTMQVAVRRITRFLTEKRTRTTEGTPAAAVSKQ